jgi:hypothetical protein
VLKLNVKLCVIFEAEKCVSKIWKAGGKRTGGKGTIYSEVREMWYMHINALIMATYLMRMPLLRSMQEQALDA